MEKKHKDMFAPWFEKRTKFRRSAIRFFIHLMGMVGMAVLYYIGFSFFFDTPLEYKMKQSTEKINKEYKLLTKQYNTVKKVMDNVVERDRNIFKILFESEPYDFDSEQQTNRLNLYERLMVLSNRKLGEEFFEKTYQFEKRVKELHDTQIKLSKQMTEMSTKTNYLPAIQPIINKELTLLTASYGMRIHPFYKTLSSHQGVDYAVSEGSSVFATADGTVRNVIKQRTSSGLTIIISHGNGYETVYSHLGRIDVNVGSSVKRGDIIALSGNTGLSLAPHLHYEVRHNSMRVDPIHYFFKELTPEEYQKMMRISQSGMRSFD